MKHWIERIADDLNEWDVDKHVVASGTSISGSIHIGNSCDVFIANAVGKSLNKMGKNFETIWIADDHDPLRKVPYPLPESYEKYLGVPYSKIPCPESCCDNFVEHFEKSFLESLNNFDIDIRLESGAKMYENGEYDDYIRISLDKASEIRNIFNKYREHALADNWLPYNPICSECGRVNTTVAYDYNDDDISYRCECGHDGVMDLKSGMGKLTWRVEWAARWKIFNVTCEPFGKDHAASGGSYDVSSVISKEIFDYKAPYPVPYEWITLKGDAMSKSKGVFFTPGQWLDIGPAESLNYFLFRSKPMKHKDFNPEMGFLDFIEQFDRAEKIYYGVEEATSSKDGEKLKLIYEMSKIHSSDLVPLRPSYRFLTVVYQIVGEDMDKIYNILKKNSQLPADLDNVKYNDLDSELKNNLEERVGNVKNWLDLYAPEFVKFEVQKKLPPVNLSDDQKGFLEDMANLISEKDLNPVELHDEMYELLNNHDLKPKKGFQAIYNVVLGKKMGPRAASFVLSLDKDFVVNRLRLKK